MRKIVYYVASSLDGFISGSNEDISGFVAGGSGVERYLSDLGQYDTVMMGRKTYEFGYKYGLKPGQRAYPHMKHYVFSNSLTFYEADPDVDILPVDIEEIHAIKSENGSDIYLCGGGQFAGWLLDNDQIDILKVKLNPLILGAGVRIFGDSLRKIKLKLLDSEKFEYGMQIMTYQILDGNS